MALAGGGIGTDLQYVVSQVLMRRNNQVGRGRHPFKYPPGQIELGAVTGAEEKCVLHLCSAIRLIVGYTPQMGTNTHRHKDIVPDTANGIPGVIRLLINVGIGIS
jgi:hypothetical protein|tara:strand:+ start:2202 stop:2516 length:315 start_codon:yes stop_codon:yes gene_type:complete